MTWLAMGDYEVCGACGDGTGGEDGVCFLCDARVDLDYTPVRASFEVETATGRVGWSGDCVAPEHGRPAIAHLPGAWVEVLEPFTFVDGTRYAFVTWLVGAGTARAVRAREMTSGRVSFDASKAVRS